MWKLEEAGQTPGLATCRLAAGSRASHFQVRTAAPSQLTSHWVSLNPCGRALGLRCPAPISHSGP